MRTANFDHLELRYCEDIKGIVPPEKGPKSFGTFEKQDPELSAAKKRILRLSRSTTLSQTWATATDARVMHDLKYTKATMMTPFIGE